MPFQKGHAPFRRAAAPIEEVADDPIPTIVSMPVARFLLADIPERGNWLLGRLAKNWPHLSEATFAGRVRAWIGSNSHLFIKTAHGAALFRIVRAELDILPIAEEIFLFTDAPKAQSSPSERAAVAMYREAMRWAKNLGASRVIIDRDSDHGGARMVALMHADEDIEVSLPIK